MSIRAIACASAACAAAAPGGAQAPAASPDPAGAELKMAAQTNRAPGDPHPWVVGNAAFQDWLDVIEGCSNEWLAQERAAAAPS